MDIQSARLKVVETARAMLEGRLSFVLGSRAILAARRWVDVPDRDTDFDVMLVIDSETENLPFGEVQKLWDAQALRRLQPDLEQAEHWARRVGTPTCQRLIARFANQNSTPPATLGDGHETK